VDKLSVEIPRENHVTAMLDIAKSLLPCLTARPWMLIRFDEPLLLTADLPVALHAPPGFDSWAGVGLGNAALVGFPIDPKQLLVLGPLGDQRCDGMILESDKATTAKDLNEQIAFRRISGSSITRRPIRSPEWSFPFGHLWLLVRSRRDEGRAD
jgi:hypothetical protein